VAIAEQLMQERPSAPVPAINPLLGRRMCADAQVASLTADAREWLAAKCAGGSADVHRQFGVQRRGRAGLARAGELEDREKQSRHGAITRRVSSVLTSLTQKRPRGPLLSLEGDGPLGMWFH
jgi:hypothetical protein